MEWLVLGCVVVFLLVLLYASATIKISERNRAKNEQWEEYSDAIQKNREADDKLNDPDYVKRLLEKDND